MNPRTALFIAMPLIVFIVLILTFFGLFSSTGVIAVIVVLYAVVSILNRRKFAKQESQKQRHTSP